MSSPAASSLAAASSAISAATTARPSARAVRPSTAAIRAPVDHPIIDHRERLSGRGETNRVAPSAIFFKEKF
jgi:hypothetical protein